MTYLPRSLGVTLLAMLVQLFLIWLFYPTPDQFVLTKTVTGTYVFDVGNSKSRTYTAIEQVRDSRTVREPLFCSVSFIGPMGSCEQKYLDGRLVTADIGRYKHLFGEGSVPMRITSNKQIFLDRDKKQWDEEWLTASLIVATFASIVIGVLFRLFELKTLRK